MAKSKFTLRKGIEADLPEIARLVHELAVHENSLAEKEIPAAQLIADGSGPDPKFMTMLAVSEEKQIIGLALYFFTYSSWKGSMLYLEDLYVSKEFRGLGIGHQLLAALIEEARTQKARKILLQAHEHNQPALAFYQSLGAHLDFTWVNCSIPV